MRDRLLAEGEADVELDSVTGEPSVLLELIELPLKLDEDDATELVWTDTVSVMESVRVEVDVMLLPVVLLELPVPIGEDDFAGAVGKPDELLEPPVPKEAPVLRDTPVLREGVGNG